MEKEYKDSLIRKTLLTFLENISNKKNEIIKCPFCDTEINETVYTTYSVIKCKTENCFNEVMKGL